ncbi:hypothetical protein MtrunA17_Chr1g0202571 [Medicago truncatula]|uniref:Uncharacterized protein n=1 Tax=Medicago truncatula TaxID=3880 RepID=A0A396K147_MEDTR|nr:hypothetical protein MtrunA17_Chr1g0202571 [Medicago truncatula]
MSSSKTIYIYTQQYPQGRNVKFENFITTQNNLYNHNQDNKLKSSLYVVIPLKNSVI